MATTTPNNGWPVPTSTDLVKNGATAIEALGDAIDATLGVYSASGFSLVAKNTFTNVSSYTLPTNTFTSTYENYRVIIQAKSTTANQSASVRLVTSGTPNTGAIYNKQHLDVYGGTASAAQYNGQTSLSDLFVVSNGVECYTTFDIFSPQLATYTGISCIQNNNSSATASQLRLQVYNTTVTTVFDSIQLYPNTSGNITGYVTVYGYKKS
jgi:hypothetical protein